MFLELMSGGKKVVRHKETGCGSEGQAHLQENMGKGWRGHSERDALVVRFAFGSGVRINWRTVILNDHQIRAFSEKGMIAPFEQALVRELEDGLPVLSYGPSSYGYDLRLSAREFLIFRHLPGTVVDPKAFNPKNLESTTLHRDASGAYFILPARSYGLGVAVEQLHLPGDVTAICVGKSTYARCGIIANVTPAEAGWKGHLTLEFSNSSAADCRIYASYRTRQGKYQNQRQRVTLPKV